MKRIICVILALIYIFTLFACGGGTEKAANGENDDTSSKSINYGIIPGDYIFDKPYGTIVKYNVHTGEMTTLCPDPFCTHDDGRCQFYRIGSNSFTSIGNTVYYITTDEATGKTAVFSFDADTAETKTVYSSDGIFSRIYSYEYKLFIYRLEGSYRGAKGSYVWYDTKTGKTEELCKDQIPQNYVFEDIIDDRIIWRPFAEYEYYSTNLKGEDFKEYDFGYRYGNHYEYVEETGEDGSIHTNLYVTLKNETERKLLIDNPQYVQFCENKIIYTKTIPYKEWKVFYYGDGKYTERDPSCGNVYIMDPDGTDDHLLFHTDECIADILQEHDKQTTRCGDYYGIHIWSFKDDTDYINMLIVNLNTGEYVISGPDR